MPESPNGVDPKAANALRASYSGTYLIQLQGLMHGRSRDDARYEADADYRVGLVNPAPPITIESYCPAAKPYVAAFQNEDHPPAGGSPSPLPELSDFAPMAGYYPFTETGFLTLLADGAASAILWLNVAGDFRASPLALPAGRWELNPPSIHASPPAPLVAVTVAKDRPDPKPDFVWDYLMTFLSTKKGTIMTAGRQMRPATASGKVWRVQR